MANELAQKTLKSSQDKMKSWHDQKARAQTFHLGDQVLVLLPLHGQPLQARYCGPYTVEQKISEVYYVIKTPDRWKEKRLRHVNMLKPYYSREWNSLSVQVTMNCVAKMDRQGDSTQKDEGTGRSPRLKNSEVLLNLEQKLVHLPA